MPARNYDRAEALRYFGAQPGDEKAAKLCDLAYLKLRNEVMARSTYLKMGCQVLEDSVLLANGTELRSKQLASHLQGCEEAVLMAATLGPKVDSALRRLALTEVALAAAAQAVAAALIEAYCNEVEEGIKAGYGPGYTFRWRFSPGYGDWPLEEQQKLFPLLACAKKIGLTLTTGGMMAPTKSVTAILGVCKGGCQKIRPYKCSTCTKLDCEYRG